MMRFGLGALCALALCAPAQAQEQPQGGEDAIPPAIHPSQNGSSGVYNVRSAFTFPHPGAAFEGNDHFFGDDDYYQPDGRAVRGVETRDSLTVNILDGFDFIAVSIFRSHKVTNDLDAGFPMGILGTAIPSIYEAFKLSKIAPDRSWAIGVEPFYEMRAFPDDFSMDFRASPFGAYLLASRDLRYDKAWPLRLHANLGYRHDRSADLLARARERGYQTPVNVPEDPQLSTAELYALGVARTPIEAGLGLFRTDQLLLGFAAEAPLKWVTPFLEYSGEIVLPGDGGRLPFASSPQRLTVGARLTPRPNYGDLSVDLALDLGLSREGQLPTAADPNVLASVDVEPPLVFTVGVGWVFGHQRIPAPASAPATVPASAPVSQPAVPAPEPPAPTGQALALLGLRLWLPAGSELSCAGFEIILCSARAPGAKAPLALRAAREGARSPFSEAGPEGRPLEEAAAAALPLAGLSAREWRGATPAGAYRVVAFSFQGVDYLLSYEGASPTEATSYDTALSTARLR